jgi:hypothetical protein
MASGILRMTDGARRVAELFGNPPRGVPQRPLWGLTSFLAFQTLPEPVRRLYGMAGWRLEGRYASLAEAAARWPSASRPWPTSRGRSVSDVLREAVARLVEERRRDERFLRLLEENVARHQRLLQALRDQGPGA